MEFKFKALSDFSADVAVFLISGSGQLPSVLNNIDVNGHIKHAVAADTAFAGKPGSTINVLAPHGFKQKRIILLCLGKPEEITPLALNSAGAALCMKLNEKKVEEVDLCLDMPEGLQSDCVTDLAIGMKLRNYGFHKHYVAKSDDHKIFLKKVNILSSAEKSEDFIKHEHIVNGTILTRDLVTESPNNLYPASFAAECKKLEGLGLKVTVLNKEDLQNLKMNALLGVAQGSVHEPKVVVMEWHGNKERPNEITALIGKGVTFDSGGINLKPSSGIADMKYDMGGAGVVTGAMMAVAARGSKANIVGIIGLVENMPSGTAQRPSDVVISMSGQTIEVDNTDAEGRLVLADVMWYVQEKYKPSRMIDLATLTGAITIALGDYCAGLFSNNDDLAGQLFKAGREVGEHLWRMPMDDFYDKQINSDIADIKNTGQSGRGAGSITAAHFLKRFVKDCAWAHLDIAGVTWTKFGTSVCPKGATGFGVRLLNKYIMDNLE